MTWTSTSGTCCSVVRLKCKRSLARSIAPLAAPQNTTSRISGRQTALRSSAATAPLRRLRLHMRGKLPRSLRPDSAAPAQSVCRSGEALRRCRRCAPSQAGKPGMVSVPPRWSKSYGLWGGGALGTTMSRQLMALRIIPNVNSCTSTQSGTSQWSGNWVFPFHENSKVHTLFRFSSGDLILLQGNTDIMLHLYVLYTHIKQVMISLNSSLV